MRLALLALVGFLLGLLVLVSLLHPFFSSPGLEQSPGVRGEVRAREGPAAGVLIRHKGTSNFTHTDNRGWFFLPGIHPGQRLTAWQPGFFIAGARVDGGPVRFRLQPLPQEDNPDYEWVDPTPDPSREFACANCHAEIYREWSASGHARSATGRHFRNLYEGTNWEGISGIGWGLLEEHPDGAGVCASCHAPSTPEALVDLRAIRGVAQQGVHCDYCHKISSVGDGPVGLTFGRFNTNLLRPRTGQLFFGSLDDVDRGEDAYSSLYRDSKYCATCHEGILFGVHVYSTYSEWLASPARQKGLHCQHCHMSPTGQMTNLAPGHGGIERDPATLGNHRFFRTSQADMLRRCVRLKVDLFPRARETQALIRIHVEGVGHRVPTGFVDRHLILVVEGTNADGQAVPVRAGPRLPAEAGAELAGLAGKVYARRLRNEKGESPVPFWRAEPEAEDNRLTPGQTEEVGVTFAPGLAQVRVRLLYRRFWAEVARVKGWPDQDLVVAEILVRP